MFGHQQNKQMAELEREPSCSIISQLAVFRLKIEEACCSSPGLWPAPRNGTPF
jgi:hypothetical protein